MDWWRFLSNNGCAERDLDLRELLDSTDFGETIRSVSAFAALAEYAESSPKNEMDYKIKGGNNMLSKKLSEKIGLHNIKLNCRVNKIVQGKRAVVYCDNGTQFEADKIICTAPTFAVKKMKWEPELPIEIQDALNALQYARINKNPILFKERFWKDESFDMVTDTPIHYLYHATKNQLSKKGVLISYSVGEKAQVMANQSDEFKSEILQQSISPYFGNVKSMIEKQVNYYWGDDEFSKGAYAIYGKGQWFGIQPLLKKPFKNTHFAGEHLADWQGFMEGAINTGEDAANAIID
jgi:monoamine oxidase